MQNLNNATVLVVEDNVSNFVLIARLLNDQGIHCEWKTSGFEVVDYIEALPGVDLILMDIRLPYEDGYDAMEKLRAHKSLGTIPIIAVTAYASPEELSRARQAGFDGFIAKPLNPDLFPQQIHRALAREPVWELGSCS